MVPTYTPYGRVKNPGVLDVKAIDNIFLLRKQAAIWCSSAVIVQPRANRYSGFIADQIS